MLFSSPSTLAKTRRSQRSLFRPLTAGVVGGPKQRFDAWLKPSPVSSKAINQGFGHRPINLKAEMRPSGEQICVAVTTLHGFEPRNQ
jgi:hypothetical protein